MCTLSSDTVSEILKAGSIYEVGGAVRDKFIFQNIKPKDHDYLVTGIPYNQLSKMLKQFGKVDLVGRSFGVIKFTQFQEGKPKTFDITLPRKEFSTGAGHKDFEVDFDADLHIETDLQRRDFTINAMAVSLEDEILIDPLDGQTDLKNKKIRMVYLNSFVDDPLRMLRAVQFAARFGFEIEKETYEALKKHAHLINTVSPERIAEELNKLLELSEKPSIGFRLMQETGLLKEILPELELCVGVEQPGGFHKYDVFEHTMHVLDAAPKNLKIRLAALFHDINKPQHRRLVDKGATFYGHEMSAGNTAQAVMSRLRYSNELIKDVKMLVERHMFTVDVTPKGLRRLIRQVGVELIFDLLDLRRADVAGLGMGNSTDDIDQFETDIKTEIESKAPFSLKDLAINGNDLMEMFDLKQGKVVGDILNYLMEKVLDNPKENIKEKLEKLSRLYYNENINTSNDKEIN